MVVAVVGTCKHVFLICGPEPVFHKEMKGIQNILSSPGLLVSVTALLTRHRSPPRRTLGRWQEAVENFRGAGDGFLLAPSPSILRRGGCAVPQFTFWSHTRLTQVSSSSGIWKERDMERVSGGGVSPGGLTESSVLNSRP